MVNQSPPPDPTIAYGQATLEDLTNEYAKHSFHISQMLGKVWTSTLVLVKAVHPAGLGPPTVDVQPMVAMIDSQGNTTPHGVIYGVPCTRVQGGANAVICDPLPGDIGWCNFASRDISSVKNSAAPAPPGSRRRFDAADAIYTGGVLNAAPTQYVQFSSAGVKIVSPVAVTIVAPVTTIQGALSVTGEVTAGADAIPLSTHLHTGVTVGGGDTGGPIV